MTEVPVHAARRLLLHGQQLCADPERRATPAAIRQCVERMGFVQVDTINVVDRAHDTILRTRFDGYRPRMLAKLLERDRSLFEHWTHDASIIPTAWYAHWKPRFARRRERIRANAWWQQRMGGDPEQVTAAVMGRIRAEGPLMSRDFESPPGGNGPWWGWKPSKAALEYLWHTGELAVAARRNFHKVYDLAERVLPEVHAAEAPDDAAHVDWACTSALERLVVATSGEVAQFLAAIGPGEARAWCERAARDDRIVRVRSAGVDGSSRPAYALPDWAARAARAPDPPERLRLLSPFDPVIRDRKRLERLFGFDYRFEAFVPEPKRRFGYYVLPILAGERFVGRLDPRFDRAAATLVIRGLWWEDDIRPTRARRRALDECLGRFAEGIGAERVRFDED